MTLLSESPNDGLLPEIGRLGGRGLRLIRRRGMSVFLLSLSLVTSAAAVAIGMSVAFLAGFESSYKWWTLVLCATIPLLIAPVMLYAVGRLILHLDETTRQLRASSLTDPLTGTRNRRGFFEAVDRIVIEPGNELTVAIVDVDDFKQVNDGHGHAVGDDGLRLVSAWLQTIVGDLGIVARMGGDEFAAIGTSERLGSVTETMEFIHHSVRFTASIGTAPYLPDEQRVEDALAAADASMYAHKGTREQRHRGASR